MRLPGYSLENLLEGLDASNEAVMELVVTLAKKKAAYDVAEDLIKKKETELIAKMYDISKSELMEAIDNIKEYKNVNR